MANLLLVFLCIISFVVQGRNTPLSRPFPTCGNSEQTCPIGCVEIPISRPIWNSYSRSSSSSNVLCINNNSPALRPYRLSGCPIGYFNTKQNTSGVCTRANDDNTTDLILTTNRLVPGLHLFKCLSNTSENGIVTSSAIVGK